MAAWARGDALDHFTFAVLNPQSIEPCMKLLTDLNKMNLVSVLSPRPESRLPTSILP